MQIDPFIQWTLIIVGSWLAGFLVFLLAVIYMPADLRRSSSRRNPLLALGGNIVGWLLILCGIALLPTPFNGLVMILVGLMIADFPRRNELLEWLKEKPSVRNRINTTRRFFGRPDLIP